MKVSFLMTFTHKNLLAMTASALILVLIFCYVLPKLFCALLWFAAFAPNNNVLETVPNNRANFNSRNDALSVPNSNRSRTYVKFLGELYSR